MSVMMLYICTKFCESILKGFRVTDLNSTVYTRVVTIYKEHNSVKTVGVMLVVLSTLSMCFLFVPCFVEIPQRISVGWLVGCFVFNGPLRQYFSLYRRIEESKNVQTTHTRTYCKHNRPLPYSIQIVGRPGTGSLPRTIAPPDHPLKGFQTN